MRVFLDTNILLDVLCNREPFVHDAQAIWLLAERGELEGLVSTLSFSNIYYILRRHGNAELAMKALRELRGTFTPVACDKSTIDHALAADFSDFEDAIQYISAREAGATCLVTRDPKHFVDAAITVVSPTLFLATYSA